MKITMLGTTGAGKTCYMLGMYSFMSVGLRGFTISATDLDKDLELTNKWETLVYGQGDDRWPKGNDANVYTYSFDFNYAARPIMNFDWIDYRGSALRSNSTEADVQELLSYVKTSNCLFLCVPGDALETAIVEENGEINYPVRQKVANKLRVTWMNKILTDIQKELSPTPAKPFPIAIVVTKYDMCMARGKAAIVKDIQQIFEPLFQPDSGWLTMICPVSLGKDLAKDRNIGEIDPVNIHLPVAFAVYAKLQQTALELKNNQSRTQQGLAADKGRNWFTRLINTEKMANKEATLWELEGKFEIIQANMRLLAQELQKASLFLGNREVNADVSL